jgi:hypothetical protein
MTIANFMAQRTAPSVLSNTMSRESPLVLTIPAAVLGDGWVDQSAAESTKPFEGPDIIQLDQPAVTNHVGMDDGDQLPASGRVSSRVGCGGPWHRGQPSCSPLAEFTM